MVSTGVASRTAPTRSTSVVELPALHRGQLAQWLDRDGELPPGAPLVPYPTDHAIDEQHRVIAGLTARERASRGRTRIQALPWLTRDDECVEVGQQADAAMRLSWNRGVAGDGPSRLTIHGDGYELTSELLEQLDGAPGRDAEPFGEVLGVAGPYACR